MADVSTQEFLLDAAGGRLLARSLSRNPSSIREMDHYPFPARIPPLPSRERGGGEGAERPAFFGRSVGARHSPTLVFLHEGLGSIAQWRDFPEALAARTGLPALIYDRLGHGGSGPLDAPRSARYLHREALEVLPGVLERCGVEDAILVGHSDGGSIALLWNL